MSQVQARDRHGVRRRAASAGGPGRPGPHVTVPELRPPGSSESIFRFLQGSAAASDCPGVLRLHWYDPRTAAAGGARTAVITGPPAPAR